MERTNSRGRAKLATSPPTALPRQGGRERFGGSRTIGSKSYVKPNGVIFPRLPQAREELSRLWGHGRGQVPAEPPVVQGIYSVDPHGDRFVLRVKTPPGKDKTITLSAEDVLALGLLIFGGLGVLPLDCRRGKASGFPGRYDRNAIAATASVSHGMGRVPRHGAWAGAPSGRNAAYAARGQPTDTAT
jgi:hypothetical protein